MRAGSFMVREMCIEGSSIPEKSSTSGKAASRSRPRIRFNASLPHSLQYQLCMLKKKTCDFRNIHLSRFGGPLIFPCTEYCTFVLLRCVRQNYEGTVRVSSSMLFTAHTSFIAWPTGHSIRFFTPPNAPPSINNSSSGETMNRRPTNSSFLVARRKEATVQYEL